jgi:hypothetical protein
LGRAPSTISRELRRGSDASGRYRPHEAPRWPRPWLGQTPLGSVRGVKDQVTRIRQGLGASRQRVTVAVKIHVDPRHRQEVHRLECILSGT